MPAGFGSGRLGAPSSSRLHATEPGVRQPERRVCSGEHLLCPHDTPASGPGVLWTPLSGRGLHSPSGRRFGHTPWDWDQSQLGRCPQESQLRAVHPRPPGPSASTTAGWLAPLLQPPQCHQALGGRAWRRERTEHVLGGCASQESNLQTGKPQGGYWLPARPWVGGRPQEGSSQCQL